MRHLSHCAVTSRAQRQLHADLKPAWDFYEPFLNPHVRVEIASVGKSGALNGVRIAIVMDELVHDDCVLWASDEQARRAFLHRRRPGASEGEIDALMAKRYYTYYEEISYRKPLLVMDIHTHVRFPPGGVLHYNDRGYSIAWRKSSFGEIRLGKLSPMVICTNSC